MVQRRLVVEVPERGSLSLQLSLPPGAPVACVLLAHALPPASAPTLGIFGQVFLDRGWAFAHVDAAVDTGDGLWSARSPEDLEAATRAIAGQVSAPLLVVAHSMGGPLFLKTSAFTPQTRATALINSPAGFDGYGDRAINGTSVTIGGRTITLGDELRATCGWPALRESVEFLRRPLLVLHAPLDNVADLSNAAHIFTAAKHPKSFFSIDSGDHLLSRPIAAQHAAEVIAAWAKRYLEEQDAATAQPAAVHVEETGTGRFRQRVALGRHRLVADEPAAVGGSDAGPGPYDFLLAGLGACTAMTVRMYADLKQIPLSGISVRLRHEKTHAQDCADCETREGKIDRIERVIHLEGPLSPEQKERLLDIANKCPVHRTLHSEVWIPTRLSDDKEN